MNVCVLLGGTSAEREVSLLSGSAMAKALITNGHDVTLLDPATNRSMEFADFHADPPHAEPPSAEMLGNISSGDMILRSLTSAAVLNADVVVFGLHGVPGEDGVMQSVLELMGKPFTGSGSRTSAIAIDKEWTKVLLRSVNVPVPEGFVVDSIREPERIGHYIARAQGELGEKIVIKPNDQGSTVGLTILDGYTSDQFDKAVRLAWRYSRKALVEEFIPGRELTVTVLGDEALPIVEIKPEGGFYDYHHKYTSGLTVYDCPADIDPRVASAIQADALRTFDIVDARGYARIDFRLRPDDSYACLEINTLPGMTATSLVPKAAKAAGMTFEELCEKILQSAFT